MRCFSPRSMRGGRRWRLSDCGLGTAGGHPSMGECRRKIRGLRMAPELRCAGPRNYLAFRALTLTILRGETVPPGWLRCCILNRVCSRWLRALFQRERGAEAVSELVRGQGMEPKSVGDLRVYGQ